MLAFDDDFWWNAPQEKLDELNLEFQRLLDGETSGFKFRGEDHEETMNSLACFMRSVRTCTRDSKMTAGPFSSTSPEEAINGESQ